MLDRIGITDDHISKALYLLIVIIGVFFLVFGLYQYILVVLVEYFQFYNIFLNINIEIIIYLGFCFIGYFIIFSKLLSGIKFNKLIRLILISLLLFTAIFLTYLGGFNFIDWMNDNDEALEVGIQYLFNGEYPYDAVTNLGNPITPFPFLFLYSIPFFLLEDVAIQNIINVILLIVIINSFKNSSGVNKQNFGLIGLVVSLPLYYYLIIQSDHLTVAVFLTLAILLLYKNKFYISAILFGILIATKGYVWVMIPSVVYYMKINQGNKEFVRSIFLLAVVSLSLILPFIFWDPRIFFSYAPLGAEASTLILPLLPGLEFLIPVIAIVISLLIMIKSKKILISFFVTYMFLGIFLFTKVMLLMCLSALLLGMFIIKKNHV